jgi:hypothetical protein
MHDKPTYIPVAVFRHFGHEELSYLLQSSAGRSRLWIRCSMTGGGYSLGGVGDPGPFG